MATTIKARPSPLDNVNHPDHPLHVRLNDLAKQAREARAKLTPEQRGDVDKQDADERDAAKKRGKALGTWVKRNASRK